MRNKTMILLNLGMVFGALMVCFKEKRRYTWAQLSDGICRTDKLKKISRGLAFSDKLLRERVLARLGISGDGFENYLTEEEYSEYMERRKIIEAISDGKLEYARELLSEYDATHNEVLERQFSMAMHGQLKLFAEENKSGLHVFFKIAAALTFPGYGHEWLAGKALSVQELNLILESIRAAGGQSVIVAYEEMLEYVNATDFDDASRVKILPQLTYYMCKYLWCHTDKSELICRRVIQLSDAALDLLARCYKMYFFYELMTLRINVLSRLKNLVSDDEVCVLKQIEKENGRQLKVICSVYAAIGCDVAMHDYCYIYAEPGARRIIDIISTRRDVVEMAHADIFEGICSENTLLRAMNGKVKTNFSTFTRILKALNLPGAFQWKAVITDNVEDMKNAIEVMSAIENGEYDYAQELIEGLEESLDSVYIVNRQFIDYCDTLITYCKGAITKKSFHMQIKKVFEYTLPLEPSLCAEDVYMTRVEISCLCCLLSTLDDDTEILRYIKLLAKICDHHEHEVSAAAPMDIYEGLMSVMASRLGDMGWYDESDVLSRKLIRMLLKNRSTAGLNNAIYNLLRNYEQRRLKNIHVNNSLDAESCLKACLILAQMTKQKKYETFYKKELVDRGLVRKW